VYRSACAVEADRRHAGFVPSACEPGSWVASGPVW